MVLRFNVFPYMGMAVPEAVDYWAAKAYEAYRWITRDNQNGEEDLDGVEIGRASCRERV